MSEKVFSLILWSKLRYVLLAPGKKARQQENLCYRCPGTPFSMPGIQVLILLFGSSQVVLKVLPVPSPLPRTHS